MTDDEKFMREALEEAKKSQSEMEVPIGAVVVYENKIISRGRNKRELSCNALSHAEIVAINNACQELNRWRLTDCTIYVTLEPCPMCAGAIIQSRIKKVYIGAMDEKTGAAGSVLNLFKDYKFNHNVELENGILEEQCKTILKDFFKMLRKK